MEAISPNAFVAISSSLPLSYSRSTTSLSADRVRRDRVGAARRLAEDPDVSVLLLEAGGDDDVPEVVRAEQWPLNLGSERDWNFTAQPNPHLNGRSIPYSMGKVLGGGSSINVMAWARGHKNDWDFFAAEAGDVIIGERAAEILQAEHTL